MLYLVGGVCILNSSDYIYTLFVIFASFFFIFHLFIFFVLLYLVRPVCKQDNTNQNKIGMQVCVFVHQFIYDITWNAKWYYDLLNLSRFLIRNPLFLFVFLTINKNQLKPELSLKYLRHCNLYRYKKKSIYVQ